MHSTEFSTAKPNNSVLLASGIYQYLLNDQVQDIVETVLLAAGEYDMVAVGRALIGDPDFVAKVEAGDYGAIRTFRRDDLGQLEWDLSIVEEAHGAG